MLNQERLLKGSEQEEASQKYLQVWKVLSTSQESVPCLRRFKQEGHEALNRSPEYTGQKSNI